MIFGISLPVFAYAFSFGGYAQPGMIDQRALMQAGIDIGDSFTIERWNATNVWAEFPLNDFTYWVRWDNDSAPPTDGLYFVRSSSIVGFLGFKRPMYCPPNFTYNWFAEQLPGAEPGDGSIIDDWDTDYNWTHAKIRGSKTWLGFGSETDVEAIFTIPLNSSDGTLLYPDIATAVINGSMVTLTLGRSFKIGEAPNLWAFTNWYSRLISGSESYGMPDILIWVMRFMALLTIMVGFMFVVELLPF